MENINYKVVGVMSGTSLDGIDLVYCSITHENGWSYTIHAAKTYSYPEVWQKSLASVIDLDSSSLEAFDIKYTKYLAEVILNFKNEFSLSEIDAVCSHGHTVFHEPHNGITKQIGNRPELATLIQEKVVCNFRVQDVALGGQGAPLVPIGDRLLFSEYDYCLNLGGFANISFEANGERIAFDVCPVNIVMNHYVKSLGVNYDDEGKIARSGTIDEKLLKALNDLSFYQQSYPKSLGLEWVKAYVFPLINSFKLKDADILRTFVAHIAIQLSRVVLGNSKVLVTGGGAYNSFLMEQTKELAQINLKIPENELVEFKEALIFAFLGVLRMCNKINCLSSVTGASKDHSSGYVYKP